MQLKFRLVIALVLSTILTIVTVLFVGYVNYFYTSEIPMTFAIIGTIITFILYSFVTCLIAYLS